MKYEMNVITRTTEFNKYDELSVNAILEYFQTSASIHATNLGFGFDEMLEDKMLWVVLRIKFEIILPIRPLEKITLVTWPEKKEKIEFGRSHVIYNSNNEIAIKGKALWVVIDSEKRRILRSRDVEKYTDSLTDESIYLEQLKRLDIIDYKALEKSYSYKVYDMDIDHNGHVNNTKYANMAFNAIDLKGRKIKSGQIDFINEVKKDDIVDIYVLDSGDVIKTCGVVNDRVSFELDIYL